MIYYDEACDKGTRGKVWMKDCPLQLGKTKQLLFLELCFFVFCFLAWPTLEVSYLSNYMSY